MNWDDDKMVALDFETSGTLPEYALQPWRVKAGDAWITSTAWSHRHLGLSGWHGPELPSLRYNLERAIREKETIICWNAPFDISWLLAYGLEDLVFQCRWLDGMLLWRHATVEPEYDVDRGNKKSYSLKECVREFLPEYAGYEEGIDFHSTDPAMMEKRLHYNKLDAMHTRRLAKHWWKQLEPTQQRAALIEAACLPMIAKANLEGMVVDTLATHELEARLTQVAVDKLNALAAAGVTEQIVRSPARLANLLFDEWGLPVLKENTGKKTKTISRSTDKEVLHELAFLDARARELKEYREALNNRTKFARKVIDSVIYNADGCTHPLANVFGTYCVPGDVEVLTRKGWVALQDWTGGEIMQAHPDLTMEFLPATRFEGPLCREWVHVKRLDCLFTPGHTIPYLAQKTYTWRTAQAVELFAGEQRYLPVAGRAKLDGKFTADQMRLFAAVQADGSFVSQKYKGKPYAPDLKFCFKKQRKIARVQQLLTACGIKHRIGKPAPCGRVDVVVARGYLPDWLGPGRKLFGPWLLDTTPDGAEAFVDELVHWDGSVCRDGGFKYTSFTRENIQWVITMCALVGRKAAIHTGAECHISDASVRACVTSRPCYTVNKFEAHRAYCATTRTGFWLARSNGRVFVTGNTGRMTYSSTQAKNKDLRQIGFALHQEKRDAFYRSIIVPPEDHVILEADAAGQEYRWMAIASKDETMLSLCAEGEDPHSYMGAQLDREWVYRELVKLYHEGDKNADRIRKGGKFANLSCQYRISPKKLRSKARVEHGMPMELPEARRIHSTYTRVYKRVPKYWTSQALLVRKQGYVETLAGRRVQINEPWNERTEWRLSSTAINYPIQGTGGDQKYLALAVLKNYLQRERVTFGWDLHDGLYFYVPTSKVCEVAREIKRRLDNLPYVQAWGFTPPIPLPWDIKVGPSWGRLKEWRDG